MSILEQVLSWGRDELKALATRIEYNRQSSDSQYETVRDSVREFRNVLSEIQTKVQVSYRDLRDAADKRENERREWERETNRKLDPNERGSTACQVAELWERLMELETATGAYEPTPKKGRSK